MILKNEYNKIKQLAQDLLMGGNTNVEVKSDGRVYKDNMLVHIIEPKLIPIIKSIVDYNKIYVGKFGREVGFPWYALNNQKDIHIIGCGSIGSWVACILAKMNPHSIHLWDEDYFEDHNTTGQIFLLKDLGRPKVLAISNLIKQTTGYDNVFTHNKRFERSDNQKTVENIFLCLDNINTRKDIVYRNTDISSKGFIIDGRIGASPEEINIEVLSIYKEIRYSLTRYLEHSNFTHESYANNRVCSASSTAFSAAAVAALMVGEYERRLLWELYYQNDPTIEFDYAWFKQYEFNNLSNPFRQE